MMSYYSYTYPTTTCSTQLGEIQPIPSEVINSRYYEGGGVPKPPLDFNKTTLSDKLYNKAKMTIKNRFAKYNEPTAQRLERNRILNIQMATQKQARRAAEWHSYCEKRRAQFEYSDKIVCARKVRRFD